MKQHLKQPFPPLAGLKTFLIVWSTQNLSTLGSAMTSFALVVWSYQQQGSAPVSYTHLTLPTTSRG